MLVLGTGLRLHWWHAGPVRRQLCSRLRLYSWLILRHRQRLLHRLRLGLYGGLGLSNRLGLLRVGFLRIMMMVVTRILFVILLVAAKHIFGGNMTSGTGKSSASGHECTRSDILHHTSAKHAAASGRSLSNGRRSSGCVIVVMVMNMRVTLVELVLI